MEVAGDCPLLTAAASLAGKISGACDEEASCWRFFLCSPRRKLLGPSLLLCVEKADPGFPDRKRLPRSSKKAFQAMSILSSRTLCPFYLLTLSCPPELKFHQAAKRHCCDLFFSRSILLLFSSRCLELTWLITSWIVSREKIRSRVLIAVRTGSWDDRLQHGIGLEKELVFITQYGVPLLRTIRTQIQNILFYL